MDYCCSYFTCWDSTPASNKPEIRVMPYLYFYHQAIPLSHPAGQASPMKVMNALKKMMYQKMIMLF